MVPHTNSRAPTGFAEDRYAGTEKTLSCHETAYCSPDRGEDLCVFRFLKQACRNRAKTPSTAAFTASKPSGRHGNGKLC